MDWIDLFTGSEGTLGVVVEAELQLLPKPADVLAGVVFLSGDDAALDAVEDWRELRGLRMIEYFDRNSLAFLRQRFPEVPENSGAALLIEQENGDVDFWADNAPEDSWFADNDRDRERFRRFRHALPELVNDTVRRRGFLKLNSDYAVPLHRNRDMLACYHTRLRERALDYVIFGHIGDAHVHVNILPSSEAEFDAGQSLMLEFARQAVALGGTVSAEHGLGKRKAKLLEIQYTPAANRSHESRQAPPGPALAPEPRHSFWLRLQPRQFLHGFKRIRFRRGFIRAITFHARETQGEPARIARAHLDFVKYDLGDQLRLDKNRVIISSDFEREQLLGLPLQHRVGQTLKGLAEHCKSAFVRIARAQVQIAQPAVPAAMSPFGRQNHEIQGAWALHLNPTLAARSRRIQCIGRFRHDAFVPALQGFVEKLLRAPNLRRGQVRHQRATRQSRQRVEAAPLRFVEQRTAIEVQQVEPERRHGQFGPSFDRHPACVRSAAW